VRPSISLISGVEEPKAQEIQSFLVQQGHLVQATVEPQDGDALVLWYLNADQREELLKARSFKDRNPGQKLILIADSWTKDSLLEAFRLGASDCLEQPVDLKTLGEIVYDIYREYQQEKANAELIMNLRQRFESNQNGNHLRLVGESEMGSTETSPSYTKIKRKWLEQFEKEYLIATLIKYRGNVSAAARDAHLDRSNFLRLLRKYGLQAHGYRRAA
jgi:DNA-binding NtrC family response regulator